MAVDAILMDLDGTLVDTAPDLASVLNTLLLHRNLPPVPFAIARNEVSKRRPWAPQIGFPRLRR